MKLISKLLKGIGAILIVAFGIAFVSMIVLLLWYALYLVMVLFV